MSGRIREPLGFLVGGGIDGYPIDHPVEGHNQIPVLRRIDFDKVPLDLVAFDDLGRATDAKNCAIHFFKWDYKFRPIIEEPLKYVSRFIDFPAILTPDITILAGMPTWQVAQNVWLARAVGAVFQAHGFQVIPTMRWNSVKDLEVITAGVPSHSAIAVSSQSVSRNEALFEDFSEGLKVIVEKTKPHSVIVYGRKIKEMSWLSESGIRLIHHAADAKYRKPHLAEAFPTQIAQVALFDL